LGAAAGAGACWAKAGIAQQRIAAAKVIGYFM
jgi:hypothetical protein